MDCGRFLRADNYTAAKDRLDYARVLIATTAMVVIKKVENLMVDGSLVVVQIVEEWGYELGDDACLLEDDNVSKVSPAAENAFHCDPDACNQVDMLIDQIAKAVSDETHAQDDDAQPVKISVGSQSDEVAGRPRERDLGQPTPVLEPVVSRQEVADVSRNRVAETAMPLISPGPGQLGGAGRAPASPQMMAKVGMTKAQCQRTKSCPPADRSGVSGPWSLEWLDAHKIGAAGVLFSSKRRPAHGSGVVGDPHKKAVRDQPKTKAGSFLQHSICSLKRIARLPIKDRREVLQILQKNARKRRPRGAASRSRETGSRASAEDGHSSSSVNNDWKHWVAMQGRDHVVEDDVMEVGNFVGATFKGVTSNMFSALSKPGTGKRDSMGVMQGEATLQEQPR
jgi:hypothetical protein